nr:RHS repeat-associated protein [Mucilaginibacter sp. X4EP1]
MLLSCLSLKGICQPSISYTNNALTFTVGSHSAPIFPVVSGTSLPYAYGQTMTIAGSGVAGYLNGTGTAAKFSVPESVVADASGNIYVTDGFNGSIREISPTGVVTTFSGYGSGGEVNGSAGTARFDLPMGISFDGSGNLYVADFYGNVIRMVSPTGTASTYAGNGTAGYVDGPMASAEFNHPMGTAVDAAGNVYVSDNYNSVIRKITPAGVVSTFAGSGTPGDDDGVGTAAQFNNPQGLTIDASGNLYVADKNNNVIRKITPAGVVSTYAADSYEALVNGDSPTASFFYPVAAAVDAIGNMYVSDQYYSVIRKITPGGVVSTLAGSGTVGSTDGIGTAASFNSPNGLAVDATGNVYVADASNNKIRKIITGAYSISPALPAGLVFDRATGGISGVPTAATPSATTYNITAVNSLGPSPPATITLAVNPQSSFNPSQSQNYIATFTPRQANITSNSLLTTASADKNQVEIAIQYYDGLGRPMQNVQVKGSPTGRDMVQPVVYDPYGREASKYLPYVVEPTASSDGSYKTTALADQPAFYANPTGNTWNAPDVLNDPYPLSSTNFEPTPLNRVVEQGAPGTAWQLNTSGINGSGHTATVDYESNDQSAFIPGTLTSNPGSHMVALYTTTINSDQSENLIRAGNNATYNTGQLYLTITRDENWNPASDGCLNTTEEYKDMQGHVVLKRTYNNTGAALQELSTYYVYDDLGNLAFVLTPQSNPDATSPISQTTLNNLCYQYQYDGRQRLILKQLPGKGAEEMVYDQIDQLLYDRDAYKMGLGEWGFTKYDGLGRVIMSGVTIDASARAPLQSYVTNMITLTDTVSQWEIPVTTNGIQGYSDTAFPWGNNQIPLVVNYYDNYTFPGQPSTATIPVGASVMTNGLLTATQTAVLNTSGIPPATPDMLWTVHYYDDLGRVTQTYNQHYLGGVLSANNFDLITTAYSFTNMPLTVTRVHSISAVRNTTTIANQYIYDHMDRKTGTWEQITYSPGIATSNTLISSIIYNELGQLMNKQLNSLDGLTFSQNIAYNYNERGWLLGSSAPLFQMQLQYNNVTGVAGIRPTAQYNGNIASESWGTSSTPNANSYVYAYDQLNRLTSGTGTTGNTESNITYDFNGNISTLNRYQTTSNTLIDQLAYTYINAAGNYTNQLQYVNDNSGYFGTTDLVNGTTNYTYDNNGNILSSINSAVTAQNKNYTYNMLNLPVTITKPTGTVTYTYDANGRKLRKVSVISGTTKTIDYIDGIEYDNSNTFIGFIQTEEGKVVPTSTTNNYMSYDYYYYLSDNLGNTRVTFDTKNGVITQLQTDDYYPFGLEVNSLVNSTKNEYLYNKKELQEELGQYDYGARFYDPVIARWTTPDPLAEKMRRFTPY